MSEQPDGHADDLRDQQVDDEQIDDESDEYAAADPAEQGDEQLDEPSDHQLDEQPDQQPGPDDGGRDDGGHDDGAVVTDDRIAAALARLDALDERPPAEHVEVYEEVHAVLQDSLAEAQGDQRHQAPGGAGQ